MSIFWNSAIFEIQILEGYNNFPVRIWHSMIIAARVKPKPSLKTRYGLEIQIFETWISTLKLVFFYCHHQIVIKAEKWRQGDDLPQSLYGGYVKFFR